MAMRNSVRNFALALTLSTAALVGVTAVNVTPVLAQTILTAADVSAIQTNLTNILGALDGMPAGPAKDAAIANAIAAATQNAIAAFGPGAAAAVAQIVLSTPAVAALPPALIGQGMAQAAVALNNSGTPGGAAAAGAIADTVANEGPPGSQNSFAAVASAAGLSTLASSATGSPSVGDTGSTGAGGDAGSAGQSSSGSGGSPGCQTPSCN
jgi:hypothetical protein